MRLSNLYLLWIIFLPHDLDTGFFFYNGLPRNMQKLQRIQNFITRRAITSTSHMDPTQNLQSVFLHALYLNPATQTHQTSTDDVTST